MYFIFDNLLEMHISKAQFVYFMTCNFPVTFFICLTYSLWASFDIDWLNFLYNFLIGYTISNFVSAFVPLVKIGKWFTKKFNVPNETYSGNIKYRLLAVFIITMIFFIFVNPVLTTFNYFYYQKTDPLGAFLDWLISLPLVLVVSYLFSLVSDFFAYRLAKKIDENF